MKFKDEVAIAQCVGMLRGTASIMEIVGKDSEMVMRQASTLREVVKTLEEIISEKKEVELSVDKTAFIIAEKA